MNRNPNLPDDVTDEDIEREFGDGPDKEDDRAWVEADRRIKERQEEE